MPNRHRDSSGLYRYLPFAVFMGFIGCEELVNFLAGQGLFSLDATALYYLYPVKALIVGCLLYLFKDRYHELNFRDLVNIPATLMSSGTGLLVFALWIKMAWTIGVGGIQQGFNPELLPGRTVQISMILIRIA